MGKQAAVSWVITNVANAKQAEALVGTVMGTRLAACANSWPIESQYWWKGKLQREREVEIHFKAAPTRVAALVKKLRDAHPYETPFIEWGTTTDVDARYASWVKREAAARPRGTRRKT